MEETAKKLGQPGLYATFKTYNEADEEEYIDKGYWGEINNMDDILDEEPSEGWAEDNEGVVWVTVYYLILCALFKYI